MIDYVTLSDAARWYVVLGAFFVMATLLRLFYLQVRRYGFALDQPRPHPIWLLGIITMLPIMVVRRFDRLGEPGDFFLWWVVAGLSVLLAGTFISVKFTLTPPWRRQGA